jgi:hypothetical protein
MQSELTIRMRLLQAGIEAIEAWCGNNVALGCEARETKRNQVLICHSSQLVGEAKAVSGSLKVHFM